MGYMGLDSISDSDNASDLSCNVFNAAAKELAKGLKESDNEFNTDGCVNVALIFEQCFCPSDDPCVYLNDELRKVARRTVKQLEKLETDSKKADWDDAANKRDHLRAYRRMIKNLQGFLVEGD